MKKPWDAAEWAMIILTSTVPLSVIGLIVMRIFTKAPLSDNAANVIDGITKIVGGGILGVLGTILTYKTKDKHEGQNIRGESKTPPSSSEG